MRDLDPGRFIRLRSAILEAMEAIDDQSRRTAGASLARAYERFRAEAYEIVPEEQRNEFDRVCPEWTRPLRHGSLLAAAIEGQSRTYDEAKVLLRTLVGFLNGYVQETQMNFEAKAYASAKLKAERPVGFQPD